MTVSLPSQPEPSSALYLMGLRSVIARCRICRSEIYRRIKEGSFPSPIKLGKRSIGFVSTEIDNWISERILERAMKGKGSTIKSCTNEVGCIARNDSKTGAK